MSSVTQISGNERDRIHNIAYKLYVSFWGKGQDAFDSFTEEVQTAIPDVQGEGEAQVDTLDGPNLSTASCINLKALIGQDERLNLVCSHFFVREEYLELDKYLSNPSNTDDVLLIGQPGIGKTIYLTYCLLVRLTKGLTTMFATSLEDRYLFRQSGVYWIPGTSIRHSPQAFTEDGEDTLALFDFNVHQKHVDVEVFRTVVATSPKLENYKQWVKQRNVKRFVMKTWSWDEVYLARCFATEAMTEEELRSKFLKYGGSARNLYKRSEIDIDELIEEGITACKDIDDLFPTTDRLRNDAIHALIQINPRLTTDGNVDRRFISGSVATPYIFHQLLKRKQHELATSMRNTFNSLSAQPALRTAAGHIFEAAGHSYIRRLLSTSLLTIQPLSKTDADDVISIDLKYINDIKYFSGAEIGRFDKVPDHYYHMPFSQTQSGIDSFVIERNNQGDAIGIVAFKFTIADSHQISPVSFRRLIIPNTQTQNLCKWKLVFVVPLTGPTFGAQPWMPPSEQNIWQGRVDQFVLRVNLGQLMA